MCGRLTLYIPIETIIEIYGIVRKIDRDLNPRYNVAPSQDIQSCSILALYCSLSLAGQINRLTQPVYSPHRPMLSEGIPG